MDALSNFVRGADLQILDSPSIVLSASLASIAENGGAQQVTLPRRSGIRWTRCVRDRFR